MRIYNTINRQLEEFSPIEPGHVGMYTCGPTVYNFAHIGNFRAYIFEDLLRRCLKRAGYRVTQVMNLTDVDDKTIAGSKRNGLPLREYTGIYKDAFFADTGKLNIERAEHYPAATDHVPEMIDLIGRLIAKKHAYKSDEGSVYFDISSFTAYGRLAHLDMTALRSGSRVANDEYEKDSASDFALWKAWDEKDGDVVWDSPWGRGRPGWHIECSAMSMKYLGESFDLHTGGIDNMFPHHENEIAQSEAATGKPFVKYWMHCGYLVVDGAKMSKSLGNFFTLRQLLEKGYTGRQVRFVLMSAHYRQPLNFTFAALDGARPALERIDEFTSRLDSVAGSSAPGKLPAWAVAAKSGFDAAIDDDMNIPAALGALFDMIHAGNREIAAGGLAPAGAAAVSLLVDDFDGVLGFIGREEDIPPAEIKGMVEARQCARREKNWKESDRLRDEMAARGWTVLDTPRGPRVKRRSMKAGDNR